MDILYDVVYIRGNSEINQPYPILYQDERVDLPAAEETKHLTKKPGIDIRRSARGGSITCFGILPIVHAVQFLRIVLLNFRSDLSVPIREMFDVRDQHSALTFFLIWEQGIGYRSLRGFPFFLWATGRSRPYRRIVSGSPTHFPPPRSTQRYSSSSEKWRHIQSDTPGMAANGFYRTEE